MAINFQQWDDLPLRNPPLVEVVCQVRFAPLLRIAEKLPSEFQELLRRRFPQFTVHSPIGIEARLFDISAPIKLPNQYDFRTADGRSAASLGVDFVALSTQGYSTWSAFLKDLALVFRAFVKTYGAVAATRVGLRYINDLTLENTGGGAFEDLTQILNPDLAKLLVNPSWSQPISLSTHLLVDNDGERLTIRLTFESAPKVHVVLDYDYFLEMSPPSELGVKRLSQLTDHYHQMIYNAFRWSIREDAMDIFRPVQ